MYTKAFQVASFVSYAIVSSIIIGGFLELSPVRKILDAQAYSTLQQELIAHNTSFMKVMMPVTITLTLITAILLYRQRGAQFYLTVLATVCIVATTVCTITLNAPINSEIEKWDASNPPSNWEQKRSDWESYHSIRVGLMSVGLVSLYLAALAPSKRTTT